MNTIKVVQHNVLHRPKKKNLTNTYLEIDPDVTLINSYGLKEGENIKSKELDCYTRNIYNEIPDGIAILVKYNLKYTIQDNFITNFLRHNRRNLG